MSNYSHSIIAPEGRLLLGFAIAIAMLVAMVSVAWSIPFWLIALSVLQFLRDPPKPALPTQNAVLSPADGRVVVMEKANDPNTGCEALKIGVFMNVFNVHSSRAPIDGKIENVRCISAKAAAERNALTIIDAQGRTVTCVQAAGVIARRVLRRLKVGEALARGQSYAFIRFGSRVDVYLPLLAHPKVAVGDKVSATKTVLAEF